MKKLWLILLLCYAGSAQAQQDTSTHRFVVKLIGRQPLPPPCGVIASALTQKFEIITTDLPFMKRGYPILLTVLCPQTLGADFFLDNMIYEVQASVSTPYAAPFSIVDRYKEKSLPAFWIKTIEQKTF